MKNFKLDSLTTFNVKPFTDETMNRYLSSIKSLIKRNQLPLKETEGYDNASMIRIDLEATMLDVKLEKYINAFDTLRNQYQKFYTKVNGSRLSLYILKIDDDRQILSLKQLLESEDYHEYIISENRELPFVLGETVENIVVIEDLTELPHLLIAGATGSGKSVMLHTLIASLLYYLSPQELQFVMFDMKMVELSFYDKLPYLAYPICTDSEEANKILENVITEMNRRLFLMNKTRSRSLSRYNKLPNIDKIPYLVIIIDEFADLILSNKTVEKTITTIAQKGRACGIHLILSTQRPSAEVVTGQIKSNIPSRVALTVSSHYDSNIILDESGAELLNKKGDMIFKCSEGLIRLQGAYLTETDIDRIVDSICDKFGVNEFCEIVDGEVTNEDDKFIPFNYTKKFVDGDIKDGKMVLNDEIYHTVTAVIERGVASKTYIMKLWKWGEKKTYKCIIRLQELGIIGEYVKTEYSYPVLVTLEDFTSKFISKEVANG